jgi:hypothetical protein
MADFFECLLPLLALIAPYSIAAPSLARDKDLAFFLCAVPPMVRQTQPTDVALLLFGF